MRHRSRAGISEAVVVIFVFLALALATPAFICYGLIDAKANVHWDLQNKIKAEEAQREGLVQRMRDAVEYGATGFDPDAANNDMKARTDAATKAADAVLKGSDKGDVWKSSLLRIRVTQPV
jgi:hypothetical protein